MSKQLEAALKWLDAFDSCVYSGPAFATEHARTIKAEMSRLTVERDPDVGHTVGDGKLREALEPFAALGGPNDGVMAAYYDCPDDLVVYANSGRGITAGDVREARRLLGMLHAPRAHQIPVWREGPDVRTPPLSPWREAIEAAAKVCDERGQWAEDKIKDGDDLTFAHYSNACNDCAEMVRSMLIRLTPTRGQI